MSVLRWITVLMVLLTSYSTYRHSFFVSFVFGVILIIITWASIDSRGFAFLSLGGIIVCFLSWIVTSIYGPFIGELVRILGMMMWIGGICGEQISKDESIFE